MVGKITKSIVDTGMGWVSVTGKHDAVQCHLRFVKYHARNSRPMPLGPDAAECVGPREEVAMSSGRDRGWIARNLGDVEVRASGVNPSDYRIPALDFTMRNLALSIEENKARSLGVPVESLGREA